MKTIIHMIAALTILGILAGGLLAYVNGWSSPLIAENERKETERAIFLVIPEGKSYERIQNAGFEVYKVFDESKSLSGYSLVYDGNGFQGKIKIMAGLNNNLEKITSIEILSQVETPGLGTKITEEPFKGQFNHLITSPSINWVKGTPASKENEIQTITGATITSKAVVDILNGGIARLRELKAREAL
jgi:Na+-translocating ferredoxin:NAD+ oxidoreductase subunit G